MPWPRHLTLLRPTSYSNWRVDIIGRWPQWLTPAPDRHTWPLPDPNHCSRFWAVIPGDAFPIVGWMVCWTIPHDLDRQGTNPRTVALLEPCYHYLWPHLTLLLFGVDPGGLMPNLQYCIIHWLLAFKLCDVDYQNSQAWPCDIKTVGNSPIFHGKIPPSPLHNPTPRRDAGWTFPDNVLTFVITLLGSC